MNNQRTMTTDEELNALRKELLSAKSPEYYAGLRRNAVKRIIQDAVFFLVIAVLAAILSQVIYAKRTGAAPNVFGCYIYRIETPSMDPTLPVGSLIVSRIPSDSGEIRIGTVVTFRTSGGERVTHRIVAVTKDDSGRVCYRTKGDNPINSVDIEPLYYSNIEAVMLFKIPIL